MFGCCDDCINAEKLREYINRSIEIWESKKDQYGDSDNSELASLIADCYIDCLKTIKKEFT